MGSVASMLQGDLLPIGLWVSTTGIAGANGVRVLKDAPVPSTGTVHSVTNSVSFLHLMMNGEDTNLEYNKSAYNITFTSESSEEERKPHGHNCNKDK